MAQTTIILDTRREKRTGKYPVKLRVTDIKVQKYYPLNLDLSKEDFEKATLPRPKGDYKELAMRFNAVEGKALKIIQSLEYFSFYAFEDQFCREHKITKSSDLESLFDEYITELLVQERAGTAISYATTKNSLLSFRSKLKVQDITLKFLQEYERYMLSKNISPSTIGIYLRQLRRIVNVSISKGLLPAEKYPFKGYSIPASRNIKKALSAQQIKALLQYQTADPELRKALDFWLFSYLSNGINMTDVCYLKPEHIQGNFFFYYRAKTRNTKKHDLRPIKVPLTDQSIAIIEKWKNRDPQNPYLFPVLHQGLTAMQAKYKIQDFIWKINKNMKVIAKELGIEVNVGTYVARHSHATILKRKGAPSEVIKENLGHSSLLVTENYLGDFTDDVKQDYARMLTDL